MVFHAFYGHILARFYTLSFQNFGESSLALFRDETVFWENKMVSGWSFKKKKQVINQVRAPTLS